MTADNPATCKIVGGHRPPLQSLTKQCGVVTSGESTRVPLPHFPPVIARLVTRSLYSFDSDGTQKYSQISTPGLKSTLPVVVHGRVYTFGSVMVMDTSSVP